MMKLKTLTVVTLVGLVSLAGTRADTIKIGYSDWPGYTVMEVAKQKGWFKDAGLDVEMDWFDYSPSIDAFSAGKIDADMIVAGDDMVSGASGAKSKIVCLVDYSEGSDMIVGAPGVDSIKDLKGKKVGVELTLVEHELLLQALKVNGLSQSDVTLVGTSTDKTPQTLASGTVAAIGAWYPISGQALKQVPGSKKLFTSADAKGLIFDVIAVSPSSYAAHKEDWAKITAIYYKCVAYLMDPATRDDAIKIMAAKVGADPADYAKNVPGTHFLTVPEAKECLKKSDDMLSIYGSMKLSDKFNLDNGVYKDSQKPESYIIPGIIMGMK
ncbi:MAG TPA: ABC transporter substrate-binding protein [Candidatus Angelobacter sp.]|jgi:NitT/TauT family transport system substrate-binding protein|nr:ABC transporter substrate-binding protein [Candidatus Angelobacter sp.]